MIQKVFVDCCRRGELIASYEYGFPASMGAPPATPDREQLIDQAKEQLTNNRLAFPPYDDITFRIRLN